MRDSTALFEYCLNGCGEISRSTNRASPAMTGVDFHQIYWLRLRVGPGVFGGPCRACDGKTGSEAVGGEIGLDVQML